MKTLKHIILTSMFTVLLIGFAHAQQDNMHDGKKEQMMEMMKDSTMRSMMMDQMMKDPKMRKQMMHKMMNMGDNQKMMQNPEMKEQMQAHMQMMQAMMDGKEKDRANAHDVHANDEGRYGYARRLKVRR